MPTEAETELKLMANGGDVLHEPINNSSDCTLEITAECVNEGVESTNNINKLKSSTVLLNNVNSPKNEPFKNRETEYNSEKNYIEGKEEKLQKNSVEDNENANNNNEKADEKASKKMVSVLKMFCYSTLYERILMIFGLVCAAVDGAALPAFSFVFSQLLKDMTASENITSATSKTAKLMCLLGFAACMLTFVHISCWTTSATFQVGRIRSRFFRACLRQDIGWHDEHSPGELTSRMTGDTVVIQNGINDNISQMVQRLSMGVLGFVFGFAYCWELTLFMIAILPVTVLVTALLGKIVASFTEKSRKHYADAGSIATEVMENVRTVQTFGKEEYETNRFASSINYACEKGVKKEFMKSGMTGCLFFIFYVNYCVAFIFGSYLLSWGRSEFNKIVATFMSSFMGGYGFGMASPCINAFNEARIVAYEIYKVIDRVPAIDIENNEGQNIMGFDDKIEFQHVRFFYPTRPDMILFKDLCLTIPKGQKIAFSGASGCGKSSIVGLIQRFYDPIGGAILCDKCDLRDANLRQWRNQIAIVSQEPALFAGSIADNVRVGKKDATMEEVIEACRKAQIHETIKSFPDQYNTELGAISSQLSGGQKQRIALARALIKKTPILLLDEATSALDRKSEAEVQQALDTLMHSSGMTVIIIAHRLATIRDVDCIYYFHFDGVEGSKITEHGTFDELMALDGEFAAMAKMQGVAPIHHCHKHNDITENYIYDENDSVKTKLYSTHLSLEGEIERNVSIISELPNNILDVAGMAELDAEAPRTERQKIPLEELARYEEQQANSSVWRIAKLNRDKLWAVMLGFVGSAFQGATAPCSMIIYGHVITALGNYDVFHDKHALHETTNKFAPMFLIFSFSGLIGWLLHGFYGYAGEYLTAKIRVMLFRQILRQDMSFFDTPRYDAGSLAGVLSGDCEAVHQLWGPSMGIKVQMGCLIAAALIVGFCHQWKVALVGLACTPFLYLGVAFSTAQERGELAKKNADNEDTVTTEAFSRIRTVTSFNMKDDRVKALDLAIRQNVRKSVKMNLVAGIGQGVTDFVFFGAFSLCLWFGSTLIEKGEANFQDVLVSSMAMLVGSNNAGDAGNFLTKFAQAEKSARRVFALIDRVPDVDVNAAGSKDVGTGCEIAFENVRFIYPARPNQIVLSSVNMHFASGSTNGLMGETGCGKSTIIQLLARFYNPRSGVIRVNDHDLSAISVAEWRKNVSIVLQEPNLFSGTVRDNIRYSRDDATNDEIEAVAKLAHIHDEVCHWPEGYNTEVGYKGQNLSGGQKQRVAIARGLLRQPRLLLLDEATSALDNVTEAKVQQGIDEYVHSNNVTTVSIAHRLTSIRYSDKITLLDTGRIIEEGSHDELMALNGEYKTRWELYNSSSH